MEKMLAARAYAGEHNFRLEEVEVPQIGATDVLVKVQAAGVSRGLLALWYFTDMIKLLPAVIGYEIAGSVAEVGREVQHVKEGDRVRVHTPLTCGRCRYCLTGQETMCRSLSIICYSMYGSEGMSLYEQYHNGGLAQYVKVPSWTLDFLPSTVSFDVAAKLNTVASAFRALKLSQVGFGATLAVTGASGAAGAAALACAPLFGCTKVIGIATRRAGLAHLEQRMAHIAGMIATDDLPDGWERRGLLKESIRTLEGNDGPDAMIDFTPFGCDVTVQTLQSLRPTGRAVLVAGNMSQLDLTYLDIMRNHYEIKGLDGGRRQDVWELLQLLGSQLLDLSSLVTHSYPLEKVNEAAEVVMGREGHPIFVVVHP
jgi:threonine dehydrogenase-like Zn-dependent dehydrogenase